MADENNPNGEGQAADQEVPQMRILGQYIKDLSFENPGAPDSLTGQTEAPVMNAAVTVQAKQRSETEFESDIKISVTAKRGDTTVFIVELVYGGIFYLANIPKEQVQQIVFIECPRQLFPFARRVIADASRDGGFPPLLLDPIDFVALYQQQLSAQQQEEANSSEKSDDAPIQ